MTLVFFVKKIIYRYTKTIKRYNDVQIYNYLKITGTSQDTVLSIKMWRVSCYTVKTMKSCNLQPPGWTSKS